MIDLDTFLKAAGYTPDETKSVTFEYKGPPIRACFWCRHVRSGVRIRSGEPTMWCRYYGTELEELGKLTDCPEFDGQAVGDEANNA